MIIVSFDAANLSMGVAVLEFDEMYIKKYNKTTKELKNHNLEINDENNAFNIIYSFNEKLIKLNKDIQSILDNIVVIHRLEVVNLLPEEEEISIHNMLKRSSRLKAFLINIDIFVEHINKNKENYQVLIEYQMRGNDKSRGVVSQLIYHYSEHQQTYQSSLFDPTKKSSIQTNVHLIGPSLKNKIHFDDGGKMHNFYSKYTKTYNANKAQSKYNCHKWMEIFHGASSKKKKNKTPNKPHDSSNASALSMYDKIKAKNKDDISDSFMMAIAWLIKTKKLKRMCN
jgi:hypothetical protein